MKPAESGRETKVGYHGAGLLPASPPFQGMQIIIVALYFLSGAAGLLYEVAWFRRLQLVFGVSAFAIGAVVSAFMLGLAFGKGLVARWGFASLPNADCLADGQPAHQGAGHQQ